MAAANLEKPFETDLFLFKTGLGGKSLDYASRSFMIKE